jgi:glycosyltransferase involved in cell wall biosynthesis
MSDEAACPIPILVMSYNDFASLRLCLRAIVNRTRRSYRLIVVDNASTDPRLVRYLRLLACLTHIAVHRNRRNFWVLGLNAPLREALKGCGPDDLFAVSDCDIIVPPPRDGRCWLSRMESLMNEHACIGKLGLSLDLGYIQSRPTFAATLAAERFFLGGPRIGETIVAGVDTTMALYRQQLFVTRQPLFVPGHQSLLRPYYYCCRTMPSFRAKHLSWRGYARRRDDDVTAKLRCMGLLGTAIAPSQVAAAPVGARIAYRLLLPLSRLFWGMSVVALQGLYALRHLPRRANLIQHARRGP